ncbi:MAG: hypothetical protein V4519_03745 [Patescibacteria group bacterium]
MTKATASASIPTTTTLNLRDFEVPHPTSRDNFVVSVGIGTKSLDDNGFVTDNMPFIEQVQRRARRHTSEGVAHAIGDMTISYLDRRIRQVVIEVKNTASRFTLKQPKVLELDPQPSLPQGFDTFRIDGLSVEAELSDNHVCGGYDGQFRCDLRYTAADGKNRSTAITDVIRRAFQSKTYTASCEQLTQGIVYQACQVLGSQGLHVIGRVYNLTGYAETHWNSRLVVPEMPRESTCGEVRESKPSRSSSSSERSMSWC